jgi:uncharacterized protein (TIGR03435 family)
LPRRPRNERLTNPSVTRIIDGRRDGLDLEEHAMRRVALVALLLSVSGMVLDGQSAAPQTFEVASVKLHPNQLRGGPRRLGEFSMPMVRLLPGGRVESSGHMLRNLIAWAYEVDKPYQKVVGNNELLLTELVIEAKAAIAELTTDDAKEMMRTLLEERFRLRWRLEPRTVDAYLLVPARDDGRPGAGLRLFTDDCAARVGNESVRFDSPEFEQKRRCGGWSSINGRQRAVGISLTGVADRLTPFMLAPVTDRTGWPGLFTFDFVGDELEMPFWLSAPNRAVTLPERDQPHLLDAIRSELGLKLVQDRATINDFVVDEVHPLIEN